MIRKNKKQENGLENFVGKDKIIGRPIRLNKQKLTCHPGKDYASVVFFGDTHYGHPCCDIERAKRMLDYCLCHNVYILGMGDYVEAGLRDSVGDSVFMQNPNPEEQMEYMIELMEPLAKKGLLLGLLMGNHEERILKTTSVNITKLMVKFLKVPYLDNAIWNLFTVGKQSYSVYALHGASGSRFIYTKMKALIDISHSFDADLIAMGHVHEIANASTLVQKLGKNNKIIECKKFHVLTGHYLKHDKSYAQGKGFPISKMGSPKVKLFSSKRDIHISE